MELNINERFKHLEQEFKELKTVLQKEDIIEGWIPEVSQQYWYLGDDGRICYSYWNNHPQDYWRYLIKNLFQTKFEAQEYKKEIELKIENKRKTVITNRGNY